jgi:hypothetical protein
MQKKRTIAVIIVYLVSFLWIAGNEIEAIDKKYSIVPMLKNKDSSFGFFTTYNEKLYANLANPNVHWIVLVRGRILPLVWENIEKERGKKIPWVL